MRLMRIREIVLGAVTRSVLMSGVASPPVARADNPNEPPVIISPGSLGNSGFVECVPAKDRRNHWVCTDTVTGEQWLCTQNFEYCVSGGGPGTGSSGGGQGGGGSSGSSSGGSSSPRSPGGKPPKTSPSVRN